jgi:hypothetical protein
VGVTDQQLVSLCGGVSAGLSSLSRESGVAWVSLMRTTGRTLNQP